MLYFNYNGKLYPADTPVVGPGNRGLRYGDGLFETLKYRNGEIVLVDEHFARLWKGISLMKFQPVKHFTADKLQTETLELIAKNKQADARIRISVFRGDGGLYDPKNHFPQYTIQSWPLAKSHGDLNVNGLQLCLYQGAKKPIDDFCNLKHNNFLPYLMGALFAKEAQCNDAIIFNTNGHICETTMANIFLISNDVIYTPALEEGCIAGVMRRQVILALAQTAFKVIETTITQQALTAADEIFLTNSIYGIRWVAGIGDKKYRNDISIKIAALLRQTNATAFC